MLVVYERARHWIIAHPVETARILSEEAKVSLPVALLQVKVRTDFSDPQPSEAHVKALEAAAPILRDERLVRPGVDLDGVIAGLIDTRFAVALTSGASHPA